MDRQTNLLTDVTTAPCEMAQGFKCSHERHKIGHLHAIKARAVGPMVRPTFSCSSDFQTRWDVLQSSSRSFWMRSTKSCFSTQPMQGALCSSRISRSALTLIFWSTSEVKGFRSVGGLGYLSSQTVSSFLDRRCSCVCAYPSMHGFGQCLSSHAALPHLRHVGWIAAHFCSCLIAHLAYFFRG